MSRSTVTLTDELYEQAFTGHATWNRKATSKGSPGVLPATKRHFRAAASAASSSSGMLLTMRSFRSGIS